MQAPAPFFVDETATFHIVVYRLLIRFFSNRCAENTIMHSIKYPFHFHLFSEISYFSRQHSAAFFDTTTFHVYADSNQILSFWHGPTQFPSPISLSTQSLHFRIRQTCAPVTVPYGFPRSGGVFIRLDTTGGIVVSVAVYISYLSLEHRVFFQRWTCVDCTSQLAQVF